MEKKNNGLVVFLILVIVALVGVVLYMSGIFNNKDTNDKKQDSESVQNENNQSNDEIENNETEEGEDLGVGHEWVTTFEYRTHFVNNYYVGDNLFGYFYESEKYTVDTMSNEVKLFLAIRSLYGSSWDKGIDYTIQVSEKDVKDAFELLFGPNATFQNQSLTGSKCGFAGFEYDSSKKVYTQSGTGCGGTALPFYKTQVISATKYSDRFEFVEKVAYVAYENGVEKVYKSKSNTTALGDSMSDNITAYYDQLDSYKWTFKYNEEEQHYYFYSVERVK